MAIRFGEDLSYVGAVLDIRSRMWLDGMEDVTAVVWDTAEQKIKHIQVGYYGIDGVNLAGGRAEIDATAETKYAVRKSLKSAALEAFCESVTAYKNGIHKGTHAEVIRGRKIPIGTKLTVFWVGERETFRSKKYSWMHETEEIAGCWDDSGRKVWIKTEYLKNIDQVKSPCAAERKKFLKSYIEKAARNLGA